MLMQFNSELEVRLKMKLAWFYLSAVLAEYPTEEEMKGFRGKFYSLLI